MKKLSLHAPITTK